MKKITGFGVILIPLFVLNAWVHAQNSSDLICDKGIFPAPSGSPKEAAAPTLTEEDTTQSPPDEPPEEACPATLKQPQQQTPQK